MNRTKIILIIFFFLQSLILGIKKEADINNITINYIDTNTIIDNYVSTYNNPNIIGNISISNTSFSSPIVISRDNSYYLTHNINNEYDKSGTIFIDYRNNIDNNKKIIIYGHNSNTLELPFKILENYYDPSYYNNHKSIYLSIYNELRIYKIFSVYVETNDFTYMNYNYDDNNWYNHLLKLQNNSLYPIAETICKSDEILILQTCSYKESYKQYPKKYLLVIARRTYNE